MRLESPRTLHCVLHGKRRWKQVAKAMKRGAFTGPSHAQWYLQNFQNSSLLLTHLMLRTWSNQKLQRQPFQSSPRDRSKSQQHLATHAYPLRTHIMHECARHGPEKLKGSVQHNVLPNSQHTHTHVALLQNVNSISDGHSPSLAGHIPRLSHSILPGITNTARPGNLSCGRFLILRILIPLCGYCFNIKGPAAQKHLDARTSLPNQGIRVQTLVHLLRIGKGLLRRPSCVRL